jgi:hypothetical protein
MTLSLPSRIIKGELVGRKKAIKADKLRSCAHHKSCRYLAE